MTLTHKVSQESSHFNHVAPLLTRVLSTSVFLMLVFYGHIYVPVFRKRKREVEGSDSHLRK